MAVHRRPAAAAQVSACAIMTVILQKESSCNCGSRTFSLYFVAHTRPCLFVSSTHSALQSPRRLQVTIETNH